MRLATTLNNPLNSLSSQNEDLYETLCCLVQSFFSFGIGDFGFMPYTYFIIGSELEISQLNNVEDVIILMEKNNTLLGGDCFTLESITSLSQIFLNNEKANPVQTKYSLIDISKFYKFDKDFCEKVALTEWDDVLKASIPWSECDYWKNHEHNRMDLAGMIIDFSNLCKQTNNEKQLYFLLSNED
jgi:hypothetical protein